jgi:hypothetical protein
MSSPPPDQNPHETPNAFKEYLDFCNNFNQNQEKEVSINEIFDKWDKLINMPKEPFVQPAPSFEFKPTKADEPDPDNVFIAQKIMGLVPCDGWGYMNFGSAGGAALMKSCKHENDTCYSTETTGNMHGKIGGCPEYNKTWWACKELIDHLKKKFQVHLTITQEGVSVALNENVPWHGGKTAMGSGSTIEAAVAQAALDLYADCR